MNSYKIGKSIESDLITIQQDIETIKSSMEDKLVDIFSAVSSTIFSGVITTVITELYGEYLKTLLDTEHEFFWNGIITLGVTVVLFMFSFLIIKFVLKTINKNPKATEEKRKSIIEILHKVILNNIIISGSYCEQFQQQMIKLVPAYENAKYPEEKEELFKKIKSLEIFLYESYYYLNLASSYFDKYSILQTKSEKYDIKLINDIGKNTLYTIITFFSENANQLINLWLELYDSDISVVNSIKNPKPDKVKEVQKILDIMVKNRIPIIELIDLSKMTSQLISWKDML